MNINQLFNNQSILNFFYKAFAYVFAVIYLLYAIVIYKQTQVMNKALITRRENFISFISFLQIAIALVIIILVFIFV